jgi:enoyl-[acyl-carrier protein] reductase I
LKTAAASGIEHLDELLGKVAEQAPDHTLVSLEDVGITTAVQATGAGRMLTGFDDLCRRVMG